MLLDLRVGVLAVSSHRGSGPVCCVSWMRPRKLLLCLVVQCEKTRLDKKSKISAASTVERRAPASIRSRRLVTINVWAPNGDAHLNRTYRLQVPAAAPRRRVSESRRLPRGSECISEGG